MPKCGSYTTRGQKCQNKVNTCSDKCHIHKKKYNKCSICLNPIIKNGRTLDCTHEFHKSCLDKWKSELKYTCPQCRKPFDEPEFKMTIRIRSIKTNEEMAHTLNVDEQTLDFFNRMNININDIRTISELELNIENLSHLNTILQDIGLSVSDFDTLVTDTE